MAVDAGDWRRVETVSVSGCAKWYRATITREARGEVLQAIQVRYRRGTRRQKTRILDEVVALTDQHRKHAIRLLATPQAPESESTRVDRRVYDEAVREALIVMWEAADRICGKRLKGQVTATAGHFFCRDMTK